MTSLIAVLIQQNKIWSGLTASTGLAKFGFKTFD